MSAVGTLTKLATDVVGKATHAVRHPRQTVSAVTGHARDLASTVTGGGQTESEDQAKEPPAAASQAKARTKTEAKAKAKSTTKAKPDVVPAPPQNTKPAKPAKPAKSVDPSVTEPKAASRQAAHQGRGADPTDDWQDELDDGSDINPATGQPHTVPDADQPLLDPGVAKAVRSEAETMERAADPDKGD